MESAPHEQVFRPRRLWTGLMVAAGLVWVAALLFLLQFRDVPFSAWGTVVFFVLFFAVGTLYYGRTAIFVDGSGVTYRGLVRTRRISFHDIRKVDVLPGPVTVYAIRARDSFVHFTSFFRHHQRLVQLLVERANLAPGA
jgi:hypothetical protein